MTGIFTWAPFCALGYLLGSIPTSLIVGRLFFGTDIRTQGSGNAGGTNAFRVFGWPAGLAVVLVDVGKGVAAVLLARAFGDDGSAVPGLLPLLAGLCAVLGHIWTVFAGFRGGKGVATSAGVLAAVEPVSFLITLAFFGVTLGLAGIVSLSSLVAAVVFPLTVTVRYLSGNPVPAFLPPVAWAFGALVVFAHRRNIARLLQGEEKRFERLRILGRLFDRR